MLRRAGIRRVIALGFDDIFREKGKNGDLPVVAGNDDHDNCFRREGKEPYVMQHDVEVGD